MPETRSSAIEDSQVEVRDHWALKDDDSRKALARVASAAGVDLTDADTFQSVFGVERLHLFQGTPDDAARRVKDWAIKRERALVDKLSFEHPEHSEAKAIAWTYVLAPDGTRLNVTAREGSTADSVTATVLALTGAIRHLEQLGFVSEKGTRR